jgi:proteasome lid subunit RPN8/RPN11
MMRAIFDHALTESPRECCGVIVKSPLTPVLQKGGSVAEGDFYVPCRNLSDSPHEQFVLCPQDWAAAEERGEITTIVHSHPFASVEASEADKVACEASGLPWLIVNPQTGDYQRIEPAGYVADLIGRPFVYGVHDCYSLVLDYYQRELGITLKHYVRDDRFGWWKDGQDLYMDRFSESGFFEVDEPVTGDLILMQIESPVANHLAIYLGDNLMLHHLVHQLSRRDVYGGYWQKHTVKYLRFQSC